ESDLGEIATSIKRSEETIARLEAVLATGDRMNVYPAIAARRHRIASIEASLVGIRNDLADRQLQLVNPSGDLAQLAAPRKQLAHHYAQLGAPEQAYTQRVQETRGGYDAIDTPATEIAGALDSSQAMAIAMRTYVMTNPPPASPADAGRAAPP